MPHEDPVVEGFEVSGVCIPAFEVGGDFFDFVRSGADGASLGIVVGDVSGKGTRAAMTARQLRDAIVKEVARVTGRPRPADDVAVVVVKAC